MGTSSLPKLATAPIEVDATTTQYNAVVDALQGHQVMRDSNGDSEDNANDIGRPSSGRPRKLYLGTGLNVAGSDIDFSSITLQTTGISSGKSKDSGYPDFLTPLGETGGATNTVLIEAATTNLVMTIDGESCTLETDLESDDLSLAPSSNNTCLINEAFTASHDKMTKTLGEYGSFTSVGAVGSEITALDGTKQYFKLVNALAETEILFAELSLNDIEPIKRGMCGTSRIAIRDGDTLTLLKAHYIFLDNDLATVDTTTTYPTWGYTAPGAPTTGDYWYDTAAETWKRYSGATWEQLGRIYLGVAICDGSDCLYAEPVNYNLAWSNRLSLPRITKTGVDTISFMGDFSVSVAGNNLYFDQSITDFSLSSNLISGESEAASTWYYLYVTSEGEMFFSAVVPRRDTFKKGFYYPNEHYRAIALIFNDSGSDIASFNYSAESDTWTYMDTTFTLVSDSVGTVNGTLYIDEIMPIVNKYICRVSADLANNANCSFSITSRETMKFTPSAYTLFSHIACNVAAATEYVFDHEISQVYNGKFYRTTTNYNPLTIILKSFDLDFKL